MKITQFIKKWWIWIVLLVLVAVVAFGYFSFGDGDGEDGAYKVKRQDLSEVIAEVGKVAPVQEVDMTFPMQDQIASISVKEGASVAKGDLLMKLDTAKTQAALAQAQASVQEAQARLDSAYAGSSVEEIRVAETSVANAESSLASLETVAASEISAAEAKVASAQITLDNVTNVLTDQESESGEGVKQAYEDALVALSDAETRADTALGTVDYIQEKYFSNYSGYGVYVQDAEIEIDADFVTLQPLIDDAVIDNYSSIDAALSATLTYSRELASALSLIRAALQDDNGISPTVTDNGYINTERTSIDVAITGLNTSIQAVSSAKLASGIDYNTAQSSINQASADLTVAEANLAALESDWERRLDDAEGAADLARDQLAVVRAGPRKADLDLYRAQVNQAIAYANLVSQDLNDSYLYAPTDGIVTNIYVEVGELTTLTTPVLSMIANSKYQIEAYISELDVASVMILNPAEITFDAFGEDKIFAGTIVSVDPFETISDGDIFYKVVIELDEYDESVRSGMTVNIRIVTAEKEGILVVPSRYVGVRDDGRYVKLKADNDEGFELVEVKTGLKGIDMTEILEGLSEGDLIIPYY